MGGPLHGATKGDIPLKTVDPQTVNMGCVKSRRRWPWRELIGRALWRFHPKPGFPPSRAISRAFRGGVQWVPPYCASTGKIDPWARWTKKPYCELQKLANPGSFFIKARIDLRTFSQRALSARVASCRARFVPCEELTDGATSCRRHTLLCDKQLFRKPLYIARCTAFEGLHCELWRRLEKIKIVENLKF